MGPGVQDPCVRTGGPSGSEVRRRGFVRAPYVDSLPDSVVSERGPPLPGPLGAAVGPAVAGLGRLASGETNLQLTSPLVWVMLGISVAGAIVTFGYLVYAVWKFRDPTKRGRRYG